VFLEVAMAYEEEKEKRFQWLAVQTYQQAILVSPEGPEK
jgi:hypothetical protein